MFILINNHSYHIYILFSLLCSGPLLNHIMKRGRLTEREASLVVRDIANGLNFLHSKGMSHRYERKKTTIIFF